MRDGFCARLMRLRSRHPRAMEFAVLFGLVFTIYALSPVIASGDSRWSVPVAHSILHEGNTNLDEFPDLLKGCDYYWADEINGHWYNRFPVGMPVLSIPPVAAAEVLLKLLFWLMPSLETRLAASASVPLESVDVISIYWRVELYAASAYTALSALFVYSLARRRLPVGYALAIVAAYTFCMPPWATGSRSLGQHGGSMLMLAIALDLMLLADRSPRLAGLAGLPLAFSFVIRPTNAIPIVCLTVLMALRQPRALRPLLLWALPVVIPFALYNWSVYDALLSPYYLPAKQLGREARPMEAALGLLVSPGRGLLIFTPLVCCGVYGVWRACRARRNALAWLTLPLIAALHYAVLTTFGDWWGGHSYGPRYFSDLSPLFAAMLIPFFEAFQESTPRAKRALAALFLLCASFGFFTQAAGACSLKSWEWNRVPNDINLNPARLWDWRDPSFLRWWKIV